LTYSVLYFSLYIHRANRNVQRTLLSQQSNLLNSVIDPPLPLPDPPAYEVRKAGLTEVLKDRWNREVEKLVRNAQETDWAQKREQYEDRLSIVWGKVRASEQGREIEAKGRELGQNVEDKARQLGQTVKDKVAEGKDALTTAKDEAKSKSKSVGREPRLLELK
jgi:altered-inheritance-of-mitochondria protein 5